MNIISFSDKLSISTSISYAIHGFFPSEFSLFNDVLFKLSGFDKFPSPIKKFLSPV
jgi:hypothetical protein